MSIKIFRESSGKNIRGSKFYLFRHFYLISVVAIAVILGVACLGLRGIFRNFVLFEADRDAIRISRALRDCEVKEFIPTDDSKEQSVSIPAEKIPQLDHELRAFLAPFGIVKIKIFNRNTRIIYSTDPDIIGKLNPDNTELAKALSGKTVSEYETKEHAWDLEGEKHYEVGIVETYVPIYNQAGKTIGCFEIYKDVTEDFHMADNILLRAGGVFFTVVLSVFFVLMFIINRAAETIKSGTAKLILSNKKLEEEIIERKHAEEEKDELQAQLRQTQKMEAVGTLAGGIAHDFNNILAAMIGYAELALQDAPDGSIARSNLEQVLIAGSRAKELVKRILTFSRKTEQQRKPIEIAPIIKEALKMLRSSIPTTVEIRQNIEATCSMILGNPTQIHQILMNLCTNAAHAMGEKGGLLEVGLSDVEIDSPVVTKFGTLQDGSYVKLVVKDTGCGMESKVIERIFEPFFTTKEVDKGTGMGLSVVHGIVEDNGGLITVDSKPGRGTTFNVFFPMIESPRIEEPETSEIVCGRGELILLVDDEKPIVEMMTQMLEVLGYAVLGKTTSIDALETFRAEPGRFDLVITDYAMPGMTGRELVEELMSIRADIPVILCTGFSEDIDSEKAMNMGIKAFVMKPVDKENLAVIIRNILDKKEITV